MRTVIATGVNQPLSPSEQDVPEPGPGEILVKVTACGVCFSDVRTACA
jgi:propanol-preferring alcohol dehydrogenase